jgi:HAD superfamily hydrolase (TIGR01509 family)
MINTLIFDLDLTLVDSLEACVQGTNLIAKRFGLPEKGSDEVLKALSLTTEAFWLKMWGSYDPAWKDYYEDVVMGQVDLNRPLYPGTLEVLQEARNRGVSMGVATNRRNPWLDLADMGIAEYFDTAVGVDRDVKPKPHPDIPQLAIKQLRADASAALLVGDSPSDMSAARAAGIRALGLTQGGTESQALIDAGAWKVRPDLFSVLELLERSAVFRLR